MKKLYFISFSFFLLLIGFSYGVVSYNKGLFPIKLLTHIYKSYYWGEAYTDNSFVDDKYQIRENLTKIDEVINKEILGQKHLNLINFITINYKILKLNLPLIIRFLSPMIKKNLTQLASIFIKI